MSLETSFHRYQKIQSAEATRNELMSRTTTSGKAGDVFNQLFADVQKAGYADDTKFHAKENRPAVATQRSDESRSDETTRHDDTKQAAALHSRDSVKKATRKEDDDVSGVDEKAETEDTTETKEPRDAKTDRAETDTDTTAEAKPEADGDETKNSAAKDGAVPELIVEKPAAPATEKKAEADIALDTKVGAADQTAPADQVAEAAGEAPAKDAKAAATSTPVPVAAYVPQQIIEKTDAKQAAPENNGEETIKQETVQPATVSFRADIAERHDPAGKKRDVAAAEPVVQAAQSAAVDVKKDGTEKDVKASDAAPAAETAAKAKPDNANLSNEQAPQQQFADNGKDIQDTAARKKEARAEAKLESSLAALTGAGQAETVSSPAAGNRAIAPNGNTPPSPSTVSGGGSPLSSQAVKAADAGTAPVSSIEALHAVAASEPVQLTGMVRAAKEPANASNLLPSEQVAVQMHRMAKGGVDKFEIQLNPGDMGRVDVSLEISKDGLVRATVTADNQNTFDMLQKDSKALERALQQAGLQTDGGSLNFNLRGEGQAQQEGKNGTGHASAWNKGRAPEETQAPPTEIVNYRVANGRVDMRV